MSRITLPEETPQDKKIVVCICGMAGTGKSTLSRKLAAKYGLKCFSGGDALRALAAEEGYNSSSRGWWESPEGLRFLAKREDDPKFDKAVDDRLLECSRVGNVILDSWTMPWLLKGGFNIWLDASQAKRAARIAERDNMTPEEALKALIEKEARTKSIYKDLYGFSLGEDFAPFNLVLDTDNLNADDVFQVLCEVIGNLFVKADA
jgi:cytidylate kinase